MTSAAQHHRRLLARWEPWLFLLPALLVFGFLVLYPLWKAGQLSLYPASLLTGGRVEGSPGFDNYREIFADAAFWRSLRITALYTVGGVAGAFGLGLGLAVLLNSRIKARSVLRSMTLLPWVLPQIVGAYIWLLIFNPQYGVANQFLTEIGILSRGQSISWLTSSDVALWSTMIVTVWRFFPIATLMLLAAMQGVPEDRYEAAAMDGAGALRRFRHVTLPGIAPVASLLVLLLSVWVFRHFGTIYAMTQGGPAGSTATIPIATYVEAFTNFDLGTASALGIVSLVISFVFSVIYLGVMRRRTAA